MKYTIFIIVVLAIGLCVAGWVYSNPALSGIYESDSQTITFQPELTITIVGPDEALFHRNGLGPMIGQHLIGISRDQQCTFQIKDKQVIFALPDQLGITIVPEYETFRIIDKNTLQDEGGAYYRKRNS